VGKPELLLSKCFRVSLSDSFSCCPRIDCNPRYNESSWLMAFPILALFLPLKPYTYAFFITTIFFLLSSSSAIGIGLILLGTLLDDNEFSIFLLFMDVDCRMYKLPKGWVIHEIKNRANKALVVDLWPLDRITVVFAFPLVLCGNMWELLSWFAKCCLLGNCRHLSIGMMRYRHKGVLGYKPEAVEI